MKYDEIVESILQDGSDLLKSNLRTHEKGRGLYHDIELLRILWQKVLTKAEDKRNQLEETMSQVSKFPNTKKSSNISINAFIFIFKIIIILQANEFDEKLNNFTSWLNCMEKKLNNMEAPSRILVKVEKQMKDQTASKN